MENITNDLKNKVKKLIIQGNLIQSIKLIRDVLRISLLDSKNCMESIRDEMRENGELPRQQFTESPMSKLLKANTLLKRAAGRINKLNYLSNQEESDELAAEIESFLAQKG